MNTTNDAVVLVVDCNEEIQCLVDYFNHVQETGQLTGIPIKKLPKGFNVLDQVRLHK